MVFVSQVVTSWNTSRLPSSCITSAYEPGSFTIPEAQRGGALLLRVVLGVQGVKRLLAAADQRVALVGLWMAAPVLLAAAGRAVGLLVAAVRAASAGLRLALPAVVAFLPGRQPVATMVEPVGAAR